MTNSSHTIDRRVRRLNQKRSNDLAAKYKNKLLEKYDRETPPPSIRDKEQMIGAHTCQRNLLRRILAGYEKVIHNAVEVNVHTDVPTGDAEKELRLKKFAKKYWLTHAPPFHVELQNRLVWDAVALPPRQLSAVLAEEHRNNVDLVLGAIRDHAHEMVMANYFGIWQRHADNPKVSTYTFARVLAKHRPVGRCTTTRQDKREDKRKNIVEEIEIVTTTETNNQTLFLQLHEHQINNTEYVRLWEPRPPAPQWVNAFLDTVDPILYPLMGIVKGDMFLDEKKEYPQFSRNLDETTVTKRVTRRGRLYSPAACLGDVTLVGWGDADMSRNRKFFSIS